MLIIGSYPVCSGYTIRIYLKFSAIPVDLSNRCCGVSLCFIECLERLHHATDRGFFELRRRQERRLSRKHTVGTRFTIVPCWFKDESCQGG